MLIPLLLVLCVLAPIAYHLGRNAAYKAGHAAGYEEGNTEQIRDLKLSAGDGNSSPSVAQIEKRVALAEMSRDSYKRDATAKHEYHQRQVAEYKKQILTLTTERDALASQVQSLKNQNPNPIVG